MGDREAVTLRNLSYKYLESVVGVTASWKKYGMKQTYSFGTGSIIYWSKDFLLVLTCSHIFRRFSLCSGPGFDSAKDLRSNVFVSLEFLDASYLEGFIYYNDWWRDLCLVIVPLVGEINTPYRAVKFIDDTAEADPSVYRRGAHVYSLYCCPTLQKDRHLLFGTSSYGRICGRDGICGDDLDPMFEPNMEFFEFNMAGLSGCSGAPIFTENLEVMGIWIQKVEEMKFGVRTSSIKEWLLYCVGLELDVNMEKTIAIVCGAISDIFKAREEERTREAEITSDLDLSACRQDESKEE